MREESDVLDCKDFTMSSVGLRTAVALVLLCSIAVLPAGAANEESGFEMEKGTPSEIGAAIKTEGKDQRTVGNLYSACEAENAAATSWCSAYLMGVADTLSIFSSHKAGLCGATYKIEQLGPIFMEWVRAHQDLKDMDMFIGVSLAFREVWPCG